MPLSICLSVNTGIHSFILQSVLRQVRSLFQSEFSIECNLVLPLSISSIFSFPYDHPVAAYVFSIILPFFLLSNFPSITCLQEYRYTSNTVFHCDTHSYKLSLYTRNYLKLYVRRLCTKQLPALTRNRYSKQSSLVDTELLYVEYKDCVG
jgi:hypothetical protein